MTLSIGCIRRRRKTIIIISLMSFFILFILHTIISSDPMDSGQKYLSLQHNIRTTCSKSLTEKFSSCVLSVFEVISEIHKVLYAYSAMRPLEQEAEFPYFIGLNNSELETVLNGEYLPLRKNYRGFYHKPLLLPKRECNVPSSQRTEILFLIKSAPQNSARRFAIRKTWADEKVFPYIQRNFLIGINENYNEPTLHEAYKFDDIIKYDFIDCYYNNTLKTWSGLTWVEEHCSGQPFVVVMDDDYLVVTERLREVLKNIKNGPSSLYMGNVVSGLGTLPHRLPASKWYISKDEFPYETFPSFISGGSVIMSRAFVSNIIKVTRYSNLVKFDDCCLAIFASRLRVNPVHLSSMHIQKTMSADTISVHGYDCPIDLLRDWYRYFQTL